MSILITEPENYSPIAIRLYQKLGHVWFGRAPVGREQEVNILVVRLSFFLDEAYLSAYPNLKAIVTPTTGLTHIHLDFCKKNHIKIFSLAQCREAIEKITSTSELTLGLLISLLRGIPKAHNAVVNCCEWNRDAFRSRQLSSLTLGIVGLGRIGGHLASYAHALGMRVQAFDPYQPDKRFEKLNVRRQSMEALLPTSDVLSIHANLTPDNHKLIGEGEISLLPAHALVINTARGALLDERAAANALRGGGIGGVAVDVLSEEHTAASIIDSPLVCAARDGLNVVITPHIGGCTTDAMHLTEESMARITAQAYLESHL